MPMPKTKEEWITRITAQWVFPEGINYFDWLVGQVAAAASVGVAANVSPYASEEDLQRRADSAARVALHVAEAVIARLAERNVAKQKELGL